MTEQTEQQAIASCKVTYFIGKLLAKAGTLTLRSDGLTFTPTALDRAMGAIDIPIPINDMEGFYYNDAMQKTLQIKTPARTHRFIGSGLNEIHENLIMLKRRTTAASDPEIPQQDSISVKPKSSDVCFNCSKPIGVNFKFCPFCRTQIKVICPCCKEVVEETWLSCPFCNTELRQA